MKFIKQLIELLHLEKIVQILKKPSFRKYIAVGIFVLLITTIFRTASLYIGREILDISLLILSPVLSVIMFGMGFIIKFYLYDRWDMLKD